MRLVTNKLIGSTLLVAGTAIGAGMLALPVSTAAYGFFPSALIFIVLWAAMLTSALLMLEVNLWLEPGTNMISMAKATLGKSGQVVAWLSYLLLLYSLMAAYLTGMDSLMISVAKVFFHYRLSLWMGATLLIVAFGSIIYSGAKPIDLLNRGLILGLVVSYFLLVIFVSPHIQSAKLLTANFSHWWVALPIIITAFGFHIIIPSLRTYLDGNQKKLRQAIIIGSCAPLAVYLLWELMILGVVPVTGKLGLLSILASGQPAVGLTQALESLLSNPWVSTASQFFVFFAISTSFIGVSYSLFDFLTDGFHIKRNRLGRLTTVFLTFTPPLIYALAYPRGFVIALGYAGIFVAILLMILPVLMVWNGRYRKKIATGYRVMGGKKALYFVCLIAITVIIAEILTNVL